jgi:uncharacterized protein YbjT (DUF2867 family)
VGRDDPLILVTGATGLTGGEVVSRLSGRGVRVRTLVRGARSANAAKAAELSRLEGVEIAEGDMAKPETLIAALRGVDRAMLISSSSEDMRDVQFSFIDTAASVGVGHGHAGLLLRSRGYPTGAGPYTVEGRRRDERSIWPPDALASPTRV